MHLYVYLWIYVYVYAFTHSEVHWDYMRYNKYQILHKIELIIPIFSVDILLTLDGHIKLGDFGSALLITKDDVSSITKGVHAYMYMCIYMFFFMYICIYVYTYIWRLRVRSTYNKK
jgi:hypothetical protein